MGRHEASRGAFRMLEGRWKMVIIFHLFDRWHPAFLRVGEGDPGRLAEDAHPAATRVPERDGIVSRTVYPQVPPKVEYELTEWGKAMCPASMPCWSGLRSVRGVPKMMRHPADRSDQGSGGSGGADHVGLPVKASLSKASPG